MPNLKRSWIQRYGFAVLAVAITLLLRLLLKPLLGIESPFLLFFTTVMLSAWYGGMGAGVAATILSACLSDYFFLSPTYSLLRNNLGQNVRLVLFMLEGLSITWVIAQLHAAKLRAEFNQHRLQESEARAKRLVDSSLIGIITADVNGTITEANDAFLKMVGYTREDLLTGKVRWDAMTPLEYRAVDRRAIAQMLTTGVNTPYEKEYIRKDGSRIPILLGSTLFEGLQEQGVGFVLDLSDRKQTEQALQQALQRLTFHVDNSPLAVVEWDRNYRVSRWSQQAEAIFGWKAEEVLGKQPSDWEFVYPEDLDEVKAVIGRLVDGSEQRNMVRNRNYTKDGLIVYCEWYSSALLDESGNFESVLCLVLDVTARKRVEEALRQSEQRYRSLVVATSQIVWTTDPEGQVVDMPEWRAYTGQSQEEVKDWGWLAAVHPEDRDRTAQVWSEAVRIKSLYQTEYRMRGVEGNYRYFSVRGVPVLADGNIREWVGTCTDITQRKSAEEQIRLHTTRLQALAEASRSFSEAVLDFQAVLDTVSRLLAELIGDTCVIRLLSKDGQWFELVTVDRFNPEAMPTDETSSSALMRELLAAPQPSDRGLTSRVMQTGQPLLIPVVSQEELRASVHQNYLPYLDRFSVHSILIAPLRVRGRAIGTVEIFRDRAGCPYNVDDLVFLQDLADRAALAIENARLYHQAVEANRLKDDFLAVVSHELRTPINAVLGWATLLRTRKFNPEKIAQALEVIERNAKLQTQLIEDLLDISCLMRGQLRLNCRPLDLIPVLEAAIKTVLPTAEAKKIQLISVLEPAVGLVWADPDRFQQVIWNLLSNAIKFTPTDGRVELRLLTVSSSKSHTTANGQRTTQKYAQIEVSDTGIGISPDFLPYVFDRFRQAENATTRSQGGLGLGLAIVRQLVELHGGTVRVDSLGIGQGATFTVQLPLWETVKSEEILEQPLLA
jgi:PAS domain S-box-containing protein